MPKSLYGCFGGSWFSLARAGATPAPRPKTAALSDTFCPGGLSDSIALSASGIECRVRLTRSVKLKLSLLEYDSQPQRIANTRMSSKESADRGIAQARKLPEIAGSLRDRVFIGTSGWAYSSWKPGFYPQALPQKRFLEYYATQLNSVEVNYTFRQSPTESMLKGWLAVSGDGFRFSFKAPQRVTHILRLKDCSETLATLSRALAPALAAGRMGVVLFQLPPNFKADVPRLDSFLVDANTCGLRMAFEFRHSTWFCDEVYAVLRRHCVALCVAESDDLATPDVVTAPFTCYRLRKSGYSRGQLDAIENTLHRRSAEGEVFAYFKHEEQPTGAICAVELFQNLQHR
jgi:uncharacterized protein YecE (DUF72 family)